MTHIWQDPHTGGWVAAFSYKDDPSHPVIIGIYGTRNAAVAALRGAA